MSDISVPPISVAQKPHSSRIFWLSVLAVVVVLVLIFTFVIRIDFLTTVRVLLAPEDKKDTEALSAFGITNAPFAFSGTGTTEWFSLTHRGAVATEGVSDVVTLADGSAVYSEVVPQEEEGEVIEIVAETPRPEGVQWQIVHAVGDTKTVLGEGRSPRLFSDDSVIALSQEGIVVIAVDTGARTLLMNSVGASGLGGAISPDGSVFTIPNATESVSFFALQGEGNAPGYQGMLPVSDGVQKDITFMDEAHVAVRGTDTISVYEVPVPEQPFARATVTFPIMK